MGTFACASLADGTNKLEVRVASILNFPNYQKGQKVEITGTVEHQGNIFLLRSQFESFANVLINIFHSLIHLNILKFLHIITHILN